MDAKTEALKPCPFCGGSETSHGYSDTSPSGMEGVVVCHSCNSAIFAEDEDDAIAAWNTLSSPEGKAEPVRVKALEWREARISARYNRLCAKTCFGTYEAIEWSDGSFGCTFPSSDDEARNDDLIVKTLDAAKAAAQSDFERRVLSCLATPPRADLEDAIARQEGFRAGVKAEREACAQTALEHKGKAAAERRSKKHRPTAMMDEIHAEERGEDIAAVLIAAAIRARSLIDEPSTTGGGDGVR